MTTLDAQAALTTTTKQGSTPPKTFTDDRIRQLDTRLRVAGFDTPAILEIIDLARPAPTDWHAAEDEHTDLGLTRCFVNDHHEVARFCYGRKTWLLWTGKNWAPDQDGAAQRLMKATVIDLLTKAKNLPFGSQRHERAIKFALRCESQRAIASALTLAESEPELAITPDSLDTDPWAFNTLSGTVDLRTGQLRPHRREDMITLLAPVAYRPDAQCPRWLRFLAEIFGGNDALIDFVQRSAGYSLTGDMSEQVFFLCLGVGANGKSVLLSTFHHIFGPYAFDPGFGVFEAASRFSPHPEQLAVLAGRRLVTASETAENARLNEQRLKVLAHGDTTSARHLYGDRFEFTPCAKIWLGVNHKPRVDDDSLGFWRSVRLIPFERQFVGAAADKHLADKLRAEAEGILSWIVAGCLRWQAEGLGLPEAVEVASDDWRAESDPLAGFLAARCIEGPNCQITAADLFRAYRSWAAEEGIPEKSRLTSTALGRRLVERYHRDKWKGPDRVTVYRGVGLRASEHGGVVT